MASPKRFIMLSDSEVDPTVKKGVIVYDFWGFDYGCTRDDERRSMCLAKLSPYLRKARSLSSSWNYLS